MTKVENGLHVQKIRVPRNAHIAMIGCPVEQATDVWLVLHGYGQLAQYFIRHFQPLISEKHTHCVIAPEGHSKFYLQGTSGRVGASWMTKEKRLSEIEDQWLLLDEVNHQFVPPQARLHVLGFSQGVATAWRWILQSAPTVASLGIWAGSLPNEWDGPGRAQIDTIPVGAMLGNQDPYIPLEKGKVAMTFLQSQIPHLQTYSFEGAHHLDAVVLKQWQQDVKKAIQGKGVV